MAEKASIYKGIKQAVYVTGLNPGTAYYMMFVHQDSGEFICTDPVTSEQDGTATFIFTYKQTNNIPTGKVTLQLFDVERNDMVAFFKNFATVIETQLKDDKDVDSYQAPETEPEPEPELEEQEP